MSEFAGAARRLPGHQFDLRFDACTKCGLSSRNCQFHACFNYRGEPGNEVFGSEKRAENPNLSQSRPAYRGRGGNRRGRGNNIRNSMSTPDVFADCEIPKFGANLPQRSYENIDRGKANRRGRGRTRQREDQWHAHQRQSTQLNPPIGRNGQYSSMMTSEPPLFYSPEFLAPSVPPEYMVTSVNPSKCRSISGLQGSSNFQGDGPTSIPPVTPPPLDLSNNRQGLPHPSNSHNKQSATLKLDNPSDDSNQESFLENSSTMQIPIPENVKTPIYYRHKSSNSEENAVNVDQENKPQPVVAQKKSESVTTATKSKKKRKKKKKALPVVSADGGNGTIPDTLTVEIDLENEPGETRLNPPLIKSEQHQENQSQAKKGIVITGAECDKKPTKREESALTIDIELNSGWIELKPHATTKLDFNDDEDERLRQKDTSVGNYGKENTGSDLNLQLQDGKRGLFVSLHKTLSLSEQQKPDWATETVPMNFGIELLDSVIHKNIDLLADEGVVIQANSVILSMNSPVIHRMTTSLELKEIDMREFSGKSVRVFVEAAYTGKLPDIPSDIFRDLHKIAHAFETEWLKRCCFAMFIEFSHQIDEIVPLYVEQVFLFEEAAYVLSKQKNVQFRDVAIARIQSTESGKKMFISKYLSEISSLSACHLDMIVSLAGSDIDSIVEPLKELLLKQLGVKETAISDECKYLLNKCDLSTCRRYSSKLFEQLFDVLQELAGNSSEDMKWVFQLHRKSAIKLKEVAKESPEKNSKEDSKAKTSRKDKWFWQK